jgi:hypothetical protein
MVVPFFGEDNEVEEGDEGENGGYDTGLEQGIISDDEPMNEDEK